MGRRSERKSAPIETDSSSVEAKLPKEPKLKTSKRELAERRQRIEQTKKSLNRNFWGTEDKVGFSTSESVRKVTSNAKQAKPIKQQPKEEPANDQPAQQQEDKTIGGGFQAALKSPGVKIALAVMVVVCTVSIIGVTVFLYLKKKEAAKKATIKPPQQQTPPPPAQPKPTPSYPGDPPQPGSVSPSGYYTQAPGQAAPKPMNMSVPNAHSQKQTPKQKLEKKAAQKKKKQQKSKKSKQKIDQNKPSSIEPVVEEDVDEDSDSDEDSSEIETDDE